jgi:hypothetical protein
MGDAKQDSASREDAIDRPFEYLLTSSEASIESFYLSRLNAVANLRKELHEIFEEWVEAEVQARLAQWLLARKNPENAAAGTSLAFDLEDRRTFRGVNTPSTARSATRSAANDSSAALPASAQLATQDPSDADAADSAIRRTVLNAPARDATARDCAARDATARDCAARNATARFAVARESTLRDSAARDAPARDVTARDATARGCPARNATIRDSADRPAAVRLSSCSKNRASGAVSAKPGSRPSITRSSIACRSPHFPVFVHSSAARDPTTISKPGKATKMLLSFRRPHRNRAAS